MSSTEQAPQNLSSAEAMQQYGRHSREHTMAQVAGIADKLLQRGSDAIASDPTAQAEKYIDPQVEQEQKGQRVGDLVYTHSSPQQGATEERATLTAEGLLGPQMTDHTVERTTDNTDEDNPDVSYKLTSEKPLDVVTTNVGAPGVTPDQDEGINTDITKYDEEGNSNTQPALTLDAKRKAAAGTLSAVRGHVAKQEEQAKKNQLSQIDGFFAKS